MTLNIKDPETDRLARNLAKITGESLTEAINKALCARLEKEMRRRSKLIDRARVDEIVRRIASRPILDDRSLDEIIGYDDYGLPG